MKFKEAVELSQNWTLMKDFWTKFFIVDKEFSWYVDYEEKKRKITIPKWRKTDLGSIPKPLWIFFDRTKWVWFILHDEIFLLYGHMYDSENNEQFLIWLFQANLILFSAILAESEIITKEFPIFKKHWTRFLHFLEATAILIGCMIGSWLPWFFPKNNR